MSEPRSSIHRAVATLAAVTVSSAIACGEERGRLDAVQVVEASGERTIESGFEHIEARYVLEISAAPDNAETVGVVASVPQSFTQDANGQPTSGPFLQFTADRASPLELEPGQTGRMTISGTGDGNPAPSSSGWPRWCGTAAGALETAKLAITGTVQHEGSTYEEARIYQTVVDLVGIGDDPAPTTPPPTTVPITFASRIGSIGQESVVSLAIEATGDVLVSATTDGGADETANLVSPALLAKLAPDGTRRYVRPLPASMLVATGGRASFMATAFYGMIDVGGGTVTAAASDVLLAGLDEEGGVAWTKTFGDSSDQTLVALVADDTGGALLAGIDQGATDFGAGPLEGTPGAAFVVRVDHTGEHLFSRRLEAIQPIQLAARPSGGSVMTALVMAPTDLGGGPLPAGATIALELGPLGEHVYSRVLDPNGLGPRSVAVDGAGDSVITVWNTVLRLDPSGNLVWQAAIVDSLGVPTPLDAAVLLDDGSVLLAATSVGLPEIRIGSMVLSLGGASVGLLAKLDGAGVPIWAEVLHCTDAVVQAKLLRRPNAVDGVIYAANLSGAAALDPPPAVAGLADVLVVGMSP